MSVEPGQIERAAQPSRDSKKYVYIIGHRDHGPVKIGVSTKPRKRLYTLQSANHAKLAILAKFRGDEKQEARLHRLLAADRLNGEWFNRSETVLHLIAHVRRGMPIEEFNECANALDQWLAKHHPERVGRAHGASKA